MQLLKMINSGLVYQQNIIEGLADTYFYRDDINKLVPDLPVYMENWYAAGAMYSTSNDLLKFTNALFGFQIINKATLEKMRKPGLDSYGYGVWSYETELNHKKYRVVKRPGQIIGAQTMLLYFPDEDITIIMLSNTGTCSLDDFANELGSRYMD